LTELQLEIMSVLWERGEASAADVRQALGRPLAQTTVLTILRRLEKRGVVTHRAVGRLFIYRARVDKARAKRSVVSDFADLADRLFGGDRAELVSHLLTESDVDADDLARLRKLIKRREDELRAEDE
jgi:predicted transcriptional regulator